MFLFISTLSLTVRAPVGHSASHTPQSSQPAVLVSTRESIPCKAGLLTVPSTINLTVLPDSSTLNLKNSPLKFSSPLVIPFSTVEIYSQRAVNHILQSDFGCVTTHSKFGSLHETHLE